jgi:hypothetical protein
MSFGMQVYAPGRAGSLSKSRPCSSAKAAFTADDSYQANQPLFHSAAPSLQVTQTVAAYSRQGRLISAWPSVLLKGDFHWRSIRGTF